MTTWQTLCCHLCDIESTLCLIVTCQSDANRPILPSKVTKQSPPKHVPSSSFINFLNFCSFWECTCLLAIEGVCKLKCL